MRWLDGITALMAMSEQIPGNSEDREGWCAVVHGVTESDVTERLKNSKVLGH